MTWQVRGSARTQAHSFLPPDQSSMSVTCPCTPSEVNESRWSHPVWLGMRGGGGGWEWRAIVPQTLLCPQVSLEHSSRALSSLALVPFPNRS